MSRSTGLRPLRLCGERSLEVFCAGVFLAFVAYFAIDLVSESLAFQIVVSVAGIGIMIAVAYFKTWTRDYRAATGRKTRRARHSAATTGTKGAMGWVSINTTNRRRSFRKRSAPSRG